MTIAMAHPTGNANVRHAALAFADAGLLGEFDTCLAWDPTWAVNHLLPQRLRTQASRRALPQAVMSVTRLHPIRELGRLAARGIGWRRLVAHERGVFSIDAVYRSLDRVLARRIRDNDSVTGIYVYEDCGLASMQAARERGIPTIYELPIGYWKVHQQLLLEERDLQPEWASTLTILEDSPDKLDRKDRELALADRVIVPSSFVRDTLATAPVARERVHILPYGCDDAGDVERGRHDSVPLRLLSVGGLSQRKGLSYLFAACKELGRSITLTVIGARGGSECPALDRELAGIRYLGSQPHDRVLAEMREHDVLVFPTLFDGFGLVMLEAMSQGLPVIATPNSGGPEIISDGVNGYLIPIRSVEALVNRLEILSNDRTCLQDMANAALATARRCSWESYRRGLLELAAPAPLVMP